MDAFKTMGRGRGNTAKAVIAVALWLLGASVILTPLSHGPAAKAPSQLPLVKPESLRYEGAFRVPKNTVNDTSFDYGGTAIAFNKKNRSLFTVGHDWNQLVSEIKIPEIVKSNSLGSLKTAEIAQPFADGSDGLMDSVDDGSISDGAIKVGGLYVRKNRLYGSAYTYYDADGGQVRSHFKSTLTLSRKNDARGMFRLGRLGAGFVSGWMADVPRAWQKAVGAPSLTGNCCIPIVSRTSYGPAAFGFNPDRLSKKRAVKVKPLVYYPQSHPTLGDWDSNSKSFNGSTSMGGLVLPKGTRSLLFFGVQGQGDFCYGTGAKCNDPADDSKGTHGYPYAYQVWAYDMNDLVQVRKGAVKPWSVRPYKVWNFKLPFSSERKRLGGVAYDAQRGRIYVSQMFGDESYPVIHLFKVES